VVSGENKRWARVAVVKLVADAIEARLGQKALDKEAQDKGARAASSAKPDRLDLES
jgi:hypothetical protein